MATDPLNQGAGALPSPWVTVTGEDPMVLGSSYAEPNNYSNDAGSYWSSLTGSDQVSEVRINAAGSGTASDETGIGVSVGVVSGADTYVRVVYNGAATNNTEIQKVIAGAFTGNVARGTLAFIPGTDTIGLQRVGNVYTVLKNSAATGITATISGMPNGSPGIAYSSANAGARIDDWSGSILPTGAVLAGTPAVASSATGALSTGIKLTASAVAAVTDSGVLSTAIKLAGSAVVALSASGALPTGGSTLGASAAVAASATADLTTQGIAHLAGTVSAVAAAAAGLTNFATVVLTSPLVTGLGSIIDAHLWPTASRLPQVGDTIYYDPTFITVNTNSQIASTSNNCTAVIQFNDGTAWRMGLIFLTPGIAAYADLASAVTGALSTSILLAVAMTVTATGTGTLSSLNAITGAAAIATSASGAVQGTSAALAGSGSIVTSESGALSTGSALAGGAGVASSAAAALAASPGGLMGFPLLLNDPARNSQTPPPAVLNAASPPINGSAVSAGTVPNDNSGDTPYIGLHKVIQSLVDQNYNNQILSINPIAVSFFGAV